jgi:hypothetical protein
MFTINNFWWAGISAAVLSLGMIAPALAQPATPATPIDSTLFTTYQSNSNKTLAWVTCGSTKDSEGCYGSGTLGPFKRACAVMESRPIYRGDTVIRDIYVLDGGNRVSSSISLYVYKRTDIVTSSNDTINITLVEQLTLPLTSGSKASCSMAANADFIFVGTDISTNAIEVNKSTYNMNGAGDFSLPVTAIVANNYGYVTITQGTTSPNLGFTVYDPSGGGVEDGARSIQCSCSIPLIHTGQNNSPHSAQSGDDHTL